MSYTLTEIRDKIEQILQDTSNQIWDTTEIDKAINDALVELSRYSPYIVKETLTTTGGSKDLDISSVSNLLYVDEVEFRVDKNPKCFRNFTIRENILTMDVDFMPAVNENVYLYCANPHVLTDSTSTLSPEEERLLIDLAASRLAISKVVDKINAVTEGGSQPWSEYRSWGEREPALTFIELRRLRSPKIAMEYPH